MRSPDATLVEHFIERSRRRLSLLSALEGIALGLFVTALVITLSWPRQRSIANTFALALVPAMIGSLICWFIFRFRNVNIARAIEMRSPECRNLVVTADELMRDRGNAPALTSSEYLTMLVFRDAARRVQSLHVNGLFPARRALIVLMIGIAAISVAAFRSAAPVVVAPERSSTGDVTAKIDGIEIVVTPPAYTGRSTTTEHNPARLQVLAGSRLEIRVRAHATGLSLETVSGLHQLKSVNGGPFVAQLTAESDGYLALQPSDSAGKNGARELIGLSVAVDQAPKVQITKPGKDLRFPDGNRALDVTIETEDDIGLASLVLKYTKVSGSDERFTFSEGSVPIAIARRDATHWVATVHWSLDPLALEAGDVVVYRAQATDHRPGSIPIESDAFIAEVVAPGSSAAGGFETDPDVERYALSQQMIILKTERLLAARSSMTVDSFASTASDISREQRSVRALYVFMMGGELAAEPTSMTMLNEEEEAAGEGELAAGYGRNQGRVALLAAIRSMSHASSLLDDTSVTQALVQEKTALTQLEKAFSHSRILLRALVEREALDLTRRMTGDIADASRSSRTLTPPESGAYVDGLQDVLASISQLTRVGVEKEVAASSAAMLAEKVLRIDPSAKSLQEIALQLSNAARAYRADRVTEARTEVSRASTALSTLLRVKLLNAPATNSSNEIHRIQGALVGKRVGTQ